MGVCIQPSIRKGARAGGSVAIVAIVLLLAGALWESETAWRAWYFGSMVGLHISLGCACLLFIGDLTGGRWNEQLVPLLDAGRRLIYLMFPLLALSFFSLENLFPWSDNAMPSGSLFPLSKDEYLSPPLFGLRVLIYATLFAVLSYGAGVSADNIRRRREGQQQPATRWGAGGIVLYAFVNLFYQVDAAMSLEPHWFSTAFPLIMMASQTLTAYCLCLAARGVLHRRGESEKPFFGNLLLATMLFWLYVAFAQFLIIWMGNLSHDIGYYLKRSTPIWIGVTIFLAVFSFALPFLLLLRPEVKLRSYPLGLVAALLLLGQLLYLSWAILPSWEPLDHWRGALYGVSALGFGGLWLSLSLPRYGREVANG